VTEHDGKWNIDLCSRRPGERVVKYRVRVYGRLWPDKPVMDNVVGTEREEAVQEVATAYPDNIYYITEEGLS
jgi:hypothetical protein